jgi:aminopeptidase N
MVGWSTYHDQWLSEGFATFSAGLYLQYTEKTPDKYFKYYQTARQRLLEKNTYGRRANDAGPLWLGLRLISARNEDAYSAVIYRKGAYVLHMLRQMMYSPKEGDKPFIDMMHDFVSQHTNQNASTASFQQVAEKHMPADLNLAGNGKLDWFFGEWVYGTAVPRYKLDYTVTEADGGKWLLKASLTQSEVTPDFMMPVPLYADFDGQVIRLGVIRMRGNSTNDQLQVILPKKPRRVTINYFHDVLEAL